MTERPATPRVSDERLAELRSTVTWRARHQTVQLIMDDLLDARRDLAALRTRLAAVERERDEIRAALVECGYEREENEWCAEGCEFGATEYDTGAIIDAHVSWCVKARAVLASTRATPGPVPEERG